MIHIGLHTFLPQSGIYYTPFALRQPEADRIIANPPFRADAPTAPGKTLPAATIIDRLATTQVDPTE